MLNDPGANGPIMGLSFLAGFGTSTFAGILSSLMVALIVGLIGKGMDILVRRYFHSRESHWRKEALKWRKQYNALRSGKKEKE